MSITKQEASTEAGQARLAWRAARAEQERLEDALLRQRQAVKELAERLWRLEHPDEQAGPLPAEYDPIPF